MFLSWAGEVPGSKWSQDMERPNFVPPRLSLKMYPIPGILSKFGLPWPDCWTAKYYFKPEYDINQCNSWNRYLLPTSATKEIYKSLNRQ